MTGHFTGITEC